MSHTTVLEFKVSDWEVLQDACKAVGAKCVIGELKLKLYWGTPYNVRAKVRLPGWRYEVGISVDGNLYYDHFGSEANTMPNLAKLRNEYTLRVAEKTARKKKRRFKRVTNASRPGWQFLEVYV